MTDARVSSEVVVWATPAPQLATASLVQRRYVAISIFLYTFRTSQSTRQNQATPPFVALRDSAGRNLDPLPRAWLTRKPLPMFYLLAFEALTVHLLLERAIELTRRDASSHSLALTC